MNWEIKKEPRQGDKRIVKRFAFLPTACIDGRQHWLEFVWTLEEYRNITWPTRYGVATGKEWTPIARASTKSSLTSLKELWLMESK